MFLCIHTYIWFKMNLNSVFSLICAANAFEIVPCALKSGLFLKSNANFYFCMLNLYLQYSNYLPYCNLANLS